MALKDEWTNKKNNVDFINADDINLIAENVIEAQSDIVDAFNELESIKSGGSAEGAGGLTEVGSVSYSANAFADDFSTYILLDGKALPTFESWGGVDSDTVEGLDAFVRNEKVKFCKIGLSTMMGEAESPLYPIAYSAYDTSHPIIGNPDILAYSNYGNARSSVCFNMSKELYADLYGDIEQELSWGDVTLTFTFYA